MTHASFRIDEHTRTIRERGHNGHARTVGSYPSTMTAKQVRSALCLYELLVARVPAGTSSAVAARREWVRAAIAYGWCAL